MELFESIDDSCNGCHTVCSISIIITNVWSTITIARYPPSPCFSMLHAEKSGRPG